MLSSHPASHDHFFIKIQPDAPRDHLQLKSAAGKGFTVNIGLKRPIGGDDQMIRLIGLQVR